MEEEDFFSPSCVDVNFVSPYVRARLGIIQKYEYTYRYPMWTFYKGIQILYLPQPSFPSGFGPKTLLYSTVELGDLEGTSGLSQI